jgi:hypothetical protein
VGAWSQSLDRDLEPVTGVEWVGLVVPGVQARHVFFWDTQLGTLIHESPFLCDGTA